MADRRGGQESSRAAPPVILAPGDRVSCIDVDLLPSEILDNQGSVGLSSANI